MTNPVTPNIGLNKIDRTSPSTTYFDLDKYIDQNADAVDQFAGAASEAIGALEKRLDTEERREVVLQPGLQIVNAERSAPFKLCGIKGRTLVNLLGREGNVEDITKWYPYQSTIANDTSNFTTGSKSIKITISTGFTAGNAGSNVQVQLNAGKYYIVVADLKNGNAASALVYLNNATGNKGLTPTTSDTTKFVPVFRAYNPTVDALSEAVISINGTAGQFGYGDAIRIYEISAAEYAALDSMTPEQVAAKYPYVDSVTPVRNPYAIRYGENLLPSLYEWNIHAQAKANGPYTLSLASTAATQNTYINIRVIPNTDYVLSGVVTGGTSTTGGYITVGWVDATGTTFISWVGEIYTGGSPRKIHSPANAVYAQVVCTTTGAGNYEFTNVMLTAGSTPKPFKPREDSMLALQTDLYADPLTGANADEVFEKDGQYFKLAKWKKVVLDGSLHWVFTNNFVGFKRVAISFTDTNFKTTSDIGVKYDGKILGFGNTHLDGDRSHIYTPSNVIYVSIYNTDSGWGDNYTPTPDEIKAYFMGWFMYTAGQNPTSPAAGYIGSGTKVWTSQLSRNSSDFVSTLPTTQALNWTPYQLVYQLATPTVEPIVSAGMLTFNEGDNKIEVGTGIVLGEKANPVLNGPHYNVNNTNYPLSLLDNKTERIIRFYKNNADDPWSKFTNLAYGNEGLYTLAANFDPSAAYSVTYLMLDKLPIAPFSGSYATNEKAMLQELTDVVQQNATAVSVLMNKKADKDAPGWITPTLLNGWIPYSDGVNYYGYPSAQYTKDSQGFVYLRGLVKKGSPSSFIFYLPEGYRPKQNITFVTICYDGIMSEQITRIKIYPNGSVEYMVGPTLTGDASWLSLNLPPFTLD
ncbi:hypothetical protein [Paenibacillus glucanolyticus]|uniref:hypothetical protein n=1 Tax=Paenibacillus glucanolyticus TaxID=59843 RepID=UPI0034CD4B89